jgi:hypothetical protein
MFYENINKEADTFLPLPNIQFRVLCHSATMPIKLEHWPVPLHQNSLSMNHRDRDVKRFSMLWGRIRSKELKPTSRTPSYILLHCLNFKYFPPIGSILTWYKVMYTTIERVHTEYAKDFLCHLNHLCSVNS